jgi:hypothetical protein
MIAENDPRRVGILEYGSTKLNTYAGQVFGEAAIEVFGDAGVEAAVLAFEDIEVAGRGGVWRNVSSRIARATVGGGRVGELRE